LKRYIEAVVEQQKLRLHGKKLYTEHVLPNPAAPGGFVHTRFWKPYTDIEDFIYKGIQPRFNEHIYGAISALSDSTVHDVINQLVKGDTIPKIEPSFRYRSFRNGVY
jgi:hypothetical protein